MVNAVHCTLQCTPHQETISSENFTEKIFDKCDVTHIFSLSKFHTKYKEHDKEFQQKTNLILVANTM